MSHFRRCFGALMRRNFIYRKRSPIGTLFEFLTPILAMLVLVIIKISLNDTSGFSAETKEADFPTASDATIPPSFFDYAQAISQERFCYQDGEDEDGFSISGIPFSGRGWPVPFVKCDSRNCQENNENAVAYCEYPILAIAPETAGDAEALQRAKSFQNYIHTTYPSLAQTLPTNHNFTRIFEGGNDEIDDYVTSDSYGDSGFEKIGIAVVFRNVGSSEKVFDYSIRVNLTNFNAPEEEAQPVVRTTPDTNILFSTFAKTPESSCGFDGDEPSLGNLQNTCHGQYIYNGALPVQRLVNDWIMDYTGVHDMGTYVGQNGVSFVPFPTREYIENGFYSAIAPFAPLLIVLGLLYPVSAIIRSISLEKEQRHKELMKMMSVPESAIGWSWFTSYFIFYTVEAIVMTGTTQALYSNSSFILLLIFWELAFISVLCFSMAIAALFARSTRGTLVGILLFFVGYFLTLSFDYSSAEVSTISLVSLHPVAAFSYGLQVIGDLEDASVGLTVDTADFSDSETQYTFNSSVISLMIDSVLWGVVYWYVNRVARGDYGQPLPYHFPFMKSYWFPSTAVHPEDAAGGDEKGDGDDVDASIPIEPVSDALRLQEEEGKSVDIRNLTKNFGTKTAVDGLTLSMYSGQVTALLGHNGAGKTTTINMLTGMLSPSGGYAKVAGKDIRTDMNQIRESTGICLQHDCLFPLLTVTEHLRFFARVKGLYEKMPHDEAEESIRTSIEDVALLEKRNTFSKDLSGGMKRKLSVAIAFCGNPKVVFLDEPTSGMDPFSRRFTWNVIRQYRQDRCIILTTHFMDEADLLGDRIAIMAGGQLRCAGSSLFLKKSFGVGYQLTIEKQPETTQHGHVKDASKSCGKRIAMDHRQVDDTVQDVVQGAVKEATVLSNVGTEMSFQLPIGSSENFVPMFRGLDEMVSRDEIVTYGVSITTLDEVFLMVARGEMGNKEEFASSRRNLMADDNDQAGGNTTTELKSHKSRMDLEQEGLFFRHVQALFTKRAMNFKRDRKAWCCSTILPALFTLVGFLIVTLLAPGRTLPLLELRLEDYNPGISSDNQKNPIPFNSPGTFPCNPGKCIYSPLGTSRTLEEATDDTLFFCGVKSLLTEKGEACFSLEEWYFALNATYNELVEKEIAELGAPSGAITLDKVMEEFGADVVSCEARCIIEDSSEIMSFVAELGSPEGSFDVPINVTNVTEASLSIANQKKQFAATMYGSVLFTRDASSTVSDSGISYSEAAVDSCSGSNDESAACGVFGGVGYIVSYNFTALHSPVLYQSVADEAIIREALDDPDFTIRTNIHPMPITKEEESVAAGQDAFSAWFLLVLSFPFVTGAFATFIVAERMSKAKHLQTVAGVKPSSYWISSLLWDFMNYQLPCWIIVAMMYATGLDSFTATSRQIASGTIVLLLVFGPAAAAFTYILTFFFKSPSMCNLFVIVFNFLIGMAGPLVTFILRIIGQPNGDSANLTDIAKIVEWILRFIPSFNLGKGLLYIINIDFLSLIYADPDMTVWSKEVVLYEVIMLLVEGFVYILIAILLDIVTSRPQAAQLVTCAPKKKIGALDLSTLDDDVANEIERVRSGGANDDLIVVNELSKVYGIGKVAVNQMSFGIPPGECFGLLGINGAGKTTTMGMLTAEFPPTTGDATLSGFSVTTQPEQTRRRIGYCPQFDAHFMNMTGREHVELYARVKGVPRELVAEAAAEKLKEVGLSEYDSDRLSSGYSGGMKRKLSVACATIGQPQIVFLDEPSTGMDPVARRDLWQVVSDMVAGEEDDPPEEKTSVILTTHSMEECEALCPRIGIMAGGQLRCLGSAQHLKTRFGRGFQVELKVNTAASTDDDFKAVLRELLTRSGSEDFNQGDLEGGETEAASEMFLGLDQAQAAAVALTGDESISSMMDANNPTGYIIYKAASSSVGVAMDELAVFCVNELRIQGVLDFFLENYEGSVLRERQDNKLRFEVSSDGTSVSNLFEAIENNKDQLKLADYSVSQTSLEQVFNMHAAEAEKAKHNTVD